MLTTRKAQLEEFDLNNDGKLDREERAALKAAKKQAKGK